MIAAAAPRLAAMIELQMWAWILQLAIISSAIYLFLRLARQSRGNRVVRMLVTGGLLVVVLLWFLTETLQLAELQHILSSVTGFVVVVLAIVFQPELRRAMGQLAGPGGERRRDQAAIGQVVAAAKAMSKRRVGALVTFERDASLDPWCERGVAIDARVDRSLLESIFEPTSPMHDGGAVLRKGRILATNCVYPLTENRDLARRYGTRHRAALGLSEETDAVTLAVSEETGRFSIAVGGELRGPIDDDALEEELTRALGGVKRRRAQRSIDVVGGLGGAARNLVRDVYWIAVSLLLGVGILWVARGQVVNEETFEVTFQLSSAMDDETTADAQVDGTLVVLELDVPDYSFATREVLGRSHDLKVVGTRAQLSRFREFARGTVSLTGRTVTDGVPFELTTGTIEWNTDVVGLEFSWDKQPADLTFVSVQERTLQLQSTDLVLDDSAVVTRVAARLEKDSFDPASVVVRGPQEVLDRLRGEGEPPLFAPLTLDADPEQGQTYALDIDPAWFNDGLSLVEPVTASPRISRGRFTSPLIQPTLVLTCLDPERLDELERWRIPAAYTVAAFKFDAIGVLPVAGVSEEMRSKLIAYVDQNLVAYVDVADSQAVDGAASLTVPIRYYLRRDFADESVRRELGFEPGDLSDWSEIVLRPQGDDAITLELVETGS